MTGLLWIIGWFLAGAAQMAFILGKLDADVESFEELWVVVFFGVAAWPFVTLVMIVWFPAKAIYNLAKPKA